MKIWNSFWRRQVTELLGNEPQLPRSAEDRRRRRTRGRFHHQLSLESLESREMLATDTWIGAGADANWTTAANWQGNVVPTAAADDIVFAATPTSAQTFVNVNANATASTFNSITFNGSGYTLSGASALTINAGGITNAAAAIGT